MRISISYSLALAALLSVGATLWAREQTQAKPEDTEVWEPVPEKVTPGAKWGEPPSNAVVLFEVQQALTSSLAMGMKNIATTLDRACAVNRAGRTKELP